MNRMLDEKNIDFRSFRSRILFMNLKRLILISKIWKNEKNIMSTLPIITKNKVAIVKHSL